jgi:hypothetical protein
MEADVPHTFSCGLTLGIQLIANMYTLQGKSYLCIPFLGIVRPQSQFPHLSVCERFIFSQDQSTYLAAATRQTDPGNI